jgi:hypothetical protein
LLALFPDFGPEWDSEHNYFRAEDGTFTRCGGFSQFSHIFRDRYEQFSPGQVSSVGSFVSECVTSGDADLRDAVAACFLENIAGERFSSNFGSHLSAEAARMFLA